MEWHVIQAKLFVEIAIKKAIIKTLIRSPQKTSYTFDNFYASNWGL